MIYFQPLRPKTGQARQKTANNNKPNKKFSYMAIRKPTMPAEKSAAFAEFLKQQASVQDS